jgi:sulfite exporter TauE/SafE
VLELSLTAAFLVGLLGGGHCVGMCGGIVGAVTMTLPNSRPKIPFLISYNFGRITSYCLAGVIAGAVGASSFFLDHVLPIEKILYALASMMLVLLGLYLAGVWRVLTKLEYLGGKLWQRIQPYSQNLLPVKSVSQSFLLGTLWGWLPCGLVYSVLVAAIATASPIQGGILMLAFGLGTLPTLLAMGMTAVRLKVFLQNLWFRRLSGLLIAGFGLLGLSSLI